MVIRKLMNFFSGSDSAGKDANRGAGAMAPGASLGGGEDIFADLEGFVDYIVRALVDHPEKVRIETTHKEDLSVINVNCEKEDIGKVIGRKGRTVMAMRTLVNGAANRFGKNVTVEIVD